MVVGSWRSGSACGCMSVLLCSLQSRRGDPSWGRVGRIRHRCGCWPCSAVLGARRSGTCCIGWWAKGDILGDGAFSVKHREAGGTKRLHGHLSDEGDDYGVSLFTLVAFRASELTWCLTHSEGRVDGFDFCPDDFGGSSGGDTVDDETHPSLANAG